MSNKPLHIVFQVLNFLCDSVSHQYQLTSDEKILLIFLSKHKGNKGIYPAIQTLARAVHRDYRNVRRTLQRLQEKKLIRIDYQAGKSSQYYLTIPGLDLSTTQGADALTLEMTPRASTPSHPGRPRPHTQGVHAPLSDKINNPMNKTERGRANRASALTDDFLVNKETKLLCIDLGFTQDEANNELDKFFNYYIGNGELKADWHRVMQNWMIRASEYKAQRSSQQKAPQQQDVVRSTVPWRNPDHATPVQTIVNGLTKGRFANGLGSKRKGTPTEN